MVKLAPAGRIAQQVGAAPVRPTTQVTAPTPTAELTAEQIAQQTKEFYSKRGTEQTKQLQTEIEKATQQVKYYQQRAKQKREENRDPSSFEDKQDRYEEVVRNLRELSKQASSGKYNFGDLKSYATEKAAYTSERRVFRRELKMAPKTYDFSKVKEGEVSYIKEYDTYYTRDPSGKLHVTTGERGREMFEKEIAAGQTFDFAERAKQERISQVEKAKAADLKMIQFEGEKPVIKEVVSSPTISEPDYFKPTVKPTAVKKETYAPSTGFFVSPTYDWGAGGTATYRAPTIEEKTEIERAQYKGSIPGIIESGKKGVKWYEQSVVEPLAKSKFFKSYKEEVVMPVAEGLAWYKGSVVEPTQEGLGWYKEKVVMPTSEYFVKPSVKIAKGAATTYKEEVVVPLRVAIPSLGQTQIGQIAEAKRIVESKKPGETVIVGLPGQIREVSVNQFKGTGLFGFGKEVYLGEVETAFTAIGKKGDYAKFQFGIEPETFGKVARYTSELGSYTLPGVFVGETAVKMGEATIGGPFGGPTSAFGYVKEHPFEVGIAAVAGGVGIKRMFKTSKIKKLSELTKPPKEKAVILEQKIAEEIVKPKIIKPRVELSMVEDITTFEIKPKVKGKIVSKEYIPEPSQIGEVIELRKIGRKPAEVFKGLAEVTPKGEYKEAIKFGDITRITEVSKEGEGFVKLFKDKEKIFEQRIDDIVKPTFKYKKPKVEKFKVDKQIGDSGVSVEEMIAGKRGKVSTVKKITDKRGEIMILDSEPKLKTKLITAEIETQKVIGTDIKAGIKQSVERARGFSDIVRVGARKEFFQLKTPKGKIKIKKKVAQEIKFGIDKEFDQILYSQFAGKKIAVKKITPKIERDITSFVGQRTVTRFTKPDTKLLKSFAKEDKRITKDIGAIRRIKKRKEFDDTVKDITESQFEKAAARKEILGRQISKLKPSKKVFQPEAPQVSEYAYGGRLGPKMDVSPVTYVEPTKAYLGKMALPKTKPAPFITGTKLKQPVGFGIGGRLPTLVPAVKEKVSIESIQPQIVSYMSPSITMKESNVVLLEKQLEAQRSADAQRDTQASREAQKRRQQLTQPMASASKPSEAISNLTSALFSAPSAKYPKPAPKIPIVTFGLSSKPLAISKPQQGYRPQAKTKSGKWMNLSRKPMTRSSALSRASRASDQTLSAQFRVKKVKGKVTNGIDNYFGATQQKYRDYRIVKGKKVPLKNQFIEKRGSRIDTRGEKQGLKLAKYVKQQGWMKKPKKKKKTKSPWLV